MAKAAAREECRGTCPRRQRRPQPKAPGPTDEAAEARERRCPARHGPSGPPSLPAALLACFRRLTKWRLFLQSSTSYCAGAFSRHSGFRRSAGLPLRPAHPFDKLRMTLSGVEWVRTLSLSQGSRSNLPREPAHCPRQTNGPFRLVLQIRQSRMSSIINHFMKM